MTQENTIRDQVRDTYGAIARGEAQGCAPGCCGPLPDISAALGYSAEEQGAVPEGANLGLGCGNPQAIAALKPGERVLDLGSGAGFDCFLAARQVGPTGQVVGVDMTADMLATARSKAADFPNVEFRLGEIEHLPLGDETVDVIMSNCVINLSPDKPQVFREAFRVLADNGRLAISDVVATGPLPEALQAQAEAYSGCVTGAALVSDIEAALKAAGFVDIEVDVKEESRAVIAEWFPGTGAEDAVASATIRARKDKSACCAPSCCG